MEVYSALAATKSHPTAEELYWLVKKRQPGISLATVYNTLDALCDHGMCRRLPAATGGARYDADLSDHLHFVTGSGDVLDVPPDLSARLASRLPADVLAEIEKRMGVRVSRVAIEVHGDRARSAGAS